MADEAVTYENYLAVDELLALQRPRSEGPEHDEMLFIIMPPGLRELWFKQVLHEVDHVIALLDAADPYHAQHSLKRILTILKVLVAQLDQRFAQGTLWPCDSPDRQITRPPDSVPIHPPECAFSIPWICHPPTSDGPPYLAHFCTVASSNGPARRLLSLG